MTQLLLPSIHCGLTTDRSVSTLETIASLQRRFNTQQQQQILLLIIIMQIFCYAPVTLSKKLMNFDESFRDKSDNFVKFCKVV